MFFAKEWNPDGLVRPRLPHNLQRCHVMGGNTGLGLQLAKLLTQKGTHVSIVARNQDRLDSTLEQLEAVEAVCAPFDGNAPDAVFTCAGAALPMYFVEMTEDDFRKGMDDAYWVQAWTGFLSAAVKLMVKQKRKGRVTLVSSIFGYINFLGWGYYAPRKQALRGLADTLQSELMLSPGLSEKQWEKPQISKEIDNPESAITPNVAARAFLRGVQKNQAHITSDFIGELFCASTRGVTPKQNRIKDAVLDILAYFVAPIWCSDVDRRHCVYLQKKGFFDQYLA
ncbi:hypothetical protein K438DRAFT_1813835 [Mycena galopus ATCC 62051]|nr:hypothetical protein K438DRAFT_1813835 [Mycena galopus ATCC 62051]